VLICYYLWHSLVAVSYIKFLSFPTICVSVCGLQAETMETLACQSGHRAPNYHLDNSDLCQTDEHKAAEQQNSIDVACQLQPARQEVKVPCVADTGKSILLQSAVVTYLSPLVKYEGSPRSTRPDV
jgi:hypothetical protein